MAESMNESINDPVVVNSNKIEPVGTGNDGGNNDRLQSNNEEERKGEYSSRATEDNIDIQAEEIYFQEQKSFAYEALLQALKIQLEYYFSPANLVRDTFLRSIMISSYKKENKDQDQNESNENDKAATENSDRQYVPISRLERFGNIQKIIHHYESQRRHFALSANDSPLTIESESFYNTIPQLLRDAALLSPTLELIIFPEENFASATEGKDILATDMLRLGVGPIQSIMSEVQNMQPTESKKGEKQAEKNIIILREMPTSATEEEIRGIFCWENCPKVKNVNNEVGNFWFVSLDGTYEQIVDTLLELRNKKFKDEFDIKARLKTESMAKPVSTNYCNGAISQNNANFSGCPSNNLGNVTFAGRPQYYRRTGKFGSSDQYTYRNRYQQTVPYSSGSRYVSANNSIKGRAYRGAAGIGRSIEEKTSKLPLPPPPPLEMEAHFPALGGAASSPNAANVTTEIQDIAPAKNDKSDASVPEGKDSPTAEKITETNESSTTKPVQAETKQTVSGYAAALLKATPTPPPAAITSSTPNASQKKSSNNIHSSQKKNNKKFIVTVPFQKSNNSSNTQIPRDAKSAGSTATTDPADRFSDSSTSSTSVTDEKSHSSSTSSPDAKDSEKTAVVAHAALKWGGKKSFADILKIKEQQKAGEA